MNTKDRELPVSGGPAGARSPNAGTMQRLALYLVGRAASQAPPHLAGRLLEEWFADFPLHAGGAAQLRFALGCCWATSIIAHEHRLAPLAAGAGSGGTVDVHSPWQPSPNTRRNLIVVLILLLHAAAICVLASGLVPRMTLHVPDSLTTHFVNEPQASPTTPPPPQPTFTAQHWDPPVPQPRIFEDDTSTTDATVVPQAPPLDLRPGEPPTPVALRVAGGPGSGFPNTEDYYPPASLRFGEAGLAAVQVCVDATGRLAGEPRIARSSGIARLDEGALRLARAGSGHYRAATENGRAVSSCFPLRVRFELRR